MRQSMNSTRTDYILITCALLITAATRLPSFDQPLGPDQGVFAVIGNGILQGEIPYKDLVDQKPPGIFFLYALAFKLFGTSTQTVYLLEMLSAMGTSLVLFVLGKRLFGTGAGFLAAVTNAIYSNGIMLGLSAAGTQTSGTYYFAALPETFISLLTAVSIYLFLLILKSPAPTSSLSYMAMLLIGVAIGLAFLLKYIVIIFFPAVLLFVWLLKSRTQPLSLKGLTMITVFVGGFLLPVIPPALYFSTNNALSETFETIITFNFFYSGIDTDDVLLRAARRTFRILTEEGLLWGLGFWGALLVVKRWRRMEPLLIVGWLISSAFAIIIQRKFFGAHYVPVIAPLSLLSAFGLLNTLNWMRSKRWHPARHLAFVSVVATLFIGTFGLQNYPYYLKWFDYRNGALSHEQFERLFSAYPEQAYSFPANNSVARYVTSNSSPSDYLMVIGGGQESVIYFLSERRSASRFIVNWFLFYGDFGENSLNRSFRDEFVEDLIEKSPAFVVLVGPPSSYIKYDNLYKVIEERYQLDTVFPDDRYVYRMVNLNQKALSSQKGQNE